MTKSHLTKKQYLEICKEIDAKFKKNRLDYIAFVKSKKGQYKYFSQFLYEEYKIKSANEIINGIKKAGFKAPSQTYFWQIIKTVSDRIEDFKPNKKEDKICYICKKKPVAQGNHAMCKDCDQKRMNAANTLCGQHGLESHNTNINYL